MCVFVLCSCLIMMKWGWFHSCGVLDKKQQTTITAHQHVVINAGALLLLLQFNIVYVASLKVALLSRCLNPQREPETTKKWMEKLEEWQQETWSRIRPWWGDPPPAG